MLEMWQWDPSKKQEVRRQELPAEALSLVFRSKEWIGTEVCQTHTLTWAHAHKKHTLLDSIRSHIEPFRSAAAIFLKASIFLSLKRVMAENNHITQRTPHTFISTCTFSTPNNRLLMCMCVFVIHNWRRKCVWLCNGRADEGGNMQLCPVHHSRAH